MSRRILVGQLSEARENYCGIGTRKTKLKLNRFATTDPRASAFRLALEIEDCSTQAKKYFGEWKDKKYAEKSELILKLVRLCQDHGWTFGKHDSKGFPRWIVYFELPNCEQISFHTNLKTPEDIPDYEKDWDGKRNSTLLKLEKAISEMFDEERNLPLNI
jgi:hypothetical protein